MCACKRFRGIIRFLSKSLQFLKKVAVVIFQKNKFTLVYLTLPGDDYELELTYNYDHEAYDLGNGYGHIAISTDDLEGLHEKNIKRLA